MYQAYVKMFALNGGDNRAEVYVTFVDLTNDVIDGGIFGMDIPFSSYNNQKELNDIIINGVMTEAMGRSLTGFTVSDIIFTLFSQVDALEAQALKGIVSSSINGKNVGNTTIFTNNSGRDFLVTGIYVKLNTITGVGTPPVINIGKTASNFNDIATLALSGLLSTAGRFVGVNINSSNASIVGDGENIVCRVPVAALLLSAYDFQVVLTGIYL